MSDQSTMDIAPPIETAFLHEPKGLTWGSEYAQRFRIRDLNKLDGALIGAASIAWTLGETSTDYAGRINRLREEVRAERERLEKELVG